MSNKSFVLKIIVSVACSFSLLSCGGGSDKDDSVETTSLSEAKQFVVDVMEDYYLYYDQMPAIDINDYSSPENVLSALLVQPDRFSYIANREAEENFFEEGTYEGLGYTRVVNNDQTDTVTYVYSESAAGRPCPNSTSNAPCLQRGDIILGGTRSGDDITLNVRRSTNAQTQNFSVTLTIGLVQINTVLASSIQMVNGQTVGYLALSNFLETTVAELDTAFALFTQNNIDELVLDLRYNGGGRVSTAQVLASYIAGTNGLGSDVARLEWNDKQRSENSNFPFLERTNQLNLNRVYALTLGGTCSASELVINALEGIVNVDVVTLGQTTCGKPVGNVGFNFDDKVLKPITFNVVNDIGNGDYFNGIAPTCNVVDDLSNNFADPNEGMYAAALFHIANGRCETIVTRPNQKRSTTSTAVFNPNPLANQF